MLTLIADLLGLEAPEDEVQLMAAADLPQPQRRLLDHGRDMTGTLEAFTGERLTLKALQVREEDHHLHRRVILLAGQEAVEYGAIRINLAALPPAVVPAVLAAEQPLGGLLTAAGLHLTSEARGFLSTRARSATEALGADGPLFGRLARLSDDAERTLAEVVEILPPFHGRD